MQTTSKRRRQLRKSERAAIPPILPEAGQANRINVAYKPKQVIFAQGDVADAIFQIRKGRVKLTVVSGDGKEAVVALQGEGEFLGEACLIGQARRRTTATALTECEIARIEKDELVRMIEQVPTLAQTFITNLLVRNARIEDDLVDYHFNSTEKRLARALMLLGSRGEQRGALRATEKFSQEMLAEMIGATRSRVSHFMNKFRQRGMIDYDGQHLEVRESLSQVLMNDRAEWAEQSEDASRR